MRGHGRKEVARIIYIFQMGEIRLRGVHEVTTVSQRWRREQYL